MDRISETRCGVDRVLRWEGFYNARDLGGLPTVTGGWTRCGRLIRSADTRFVTAAGWKAARDAGIRVVIDLRNPDEVTPGSVPALTLGAGTFAVPADRTATTRPQTSRPCSYPSTTSKTSTCGAASTAKG